jgi:hypothetical protein
MSRVSMLRLFGVVSRRCGELSRPFSSNFFSADQDLQIRAAGRGTTTFMSVLPAAHTLHQLRVPSAQNAGPNDP